MADPFFMETLMEQIRSQIKTDARGTTPERRARVLSQGQLSATDQLEFRLRQHQPSAGSGARKLKSYDELAEVRAELQMCLTALNQFGEVNPRPTGYWNDRIQTGKRFLRRTLVWSMRPLRLFHGAVIRTLQALLVALEKQQETLGECAVNEDLLVAEKRLDDLEQGLCQIYELTRWAIEDRKSQSLLVAEGLRGLQESLLELRSEIAANRRQFDGFRAGHISPESSAATRFAMRTDSREAKTSLAKDKGDLS